MVLHTYSSDVLQIQLLPVNSYFKVAQPCTWSFTDFRHFGENDLVERSQAATTYNNSLRAIEARKNISNRMKRLIGCLLYKGATYAGDGSQQSVEQSVINIGRSYVTDDQLEQPPLKKRHRRRQQQHQQDMDHTTGRPSSSHHDSEHVDFSVMLKPPSIFDRYTVGDFDVSQAFYELQLDLTKRKQNFHLESELHYILAVSSIFLVKRGRMPDGITSRFSWQELDATTKDLYSKIDTTDTKNSRLPLPLINELIAVVEDVKYGIKSRPQGRCSLLAKEGSLTNNEFNIVKSVANMIGRLPNEVVREDIMESELYAPYLEPLLGGLFDDPTNHVFFRWTEQVNMESEVSESPPDYCITKESGGKWKYHLGFGEVKCAGEGENMHFICQDLLRLGIFSKNAIDVKNMKGVLTFQAVGRSITFYLTTLLKDGLYVMVELAHIQAPCCISDILSYLMCFNQVLLVLNVYDEWCCPLAPSEITIKEQRSRPGISSAVFSHLVSPTMRRSQPS